MTAPTPRRAEIQARLTAATPGPWCVALGSGRNVCTAVVRSTADDPSTFVADCLPDWALPSAEMDHRPNMDLIAHAPTDLTWLLAETQRLEADLAALVTEGRKVALAFHDWPAYISDFANGERRRALDDFVVALVRTAAPVGGA